MKKLTRNEYIGVSVSMAVVGFLLFGAQFWSLFNTNNILGAEAALTSQVMDIPSSGVKTEDLVLGTGPTASVGDTVTVNYVGMLPDGKVFDSSYDRNEPFIFKLGEGRVIRGWEEGFQGMKVGGKRRLIIAPDYAYGNQHVGPIPANSPLIFEVELLNVTR